MGLFRKHNNGIARAFEKVMEHGTRETESEFLDSLNLIVNAVVEDDSYSINEKLRIYELLTMIANCAPSQRKKYAKKLTRVLS